MEKNNYLDVEKYIENENIEIPEGLEPENMRLKLEKAGQKKAVSYRKWMAPLATAACLVILVGAGIYTEDFGTNNQESVAHNVSINEPVNNTAAPKVEEVLSDEEKDITAIYNSSKEFYDKIYNFIDENRGQVEDYYTYSSIMSDADGAEPEEALDQAATGSVAVNTTTSSSEKSSSRGDAKYASDDYAQTNVQVEFVDEGDIVKNDGRYLYQLINDETQKIQIIDTEGDLKEASCIDGFSGISEFYISDNTLVVVEDLWAVDEGSVSTGTVSEDAEICYSYPYSNTTSFCYIHFYDITDKNVPKEINKFTIKGAYKTSRISDGFLYFLCGYSTKVAESREDLEAYIPVVDGEVLGEDSIYIPEQSNATNYLMMVSVDISNPMELADKMAVISSGDNYYVSEGNIYVLDGVDGKIKDGIVSDCTEIMKFSYDKGKISPAAEGAVNGMVLDQFAMDEHEGYFRLITTVSPYEAEEVTNHIDGDSLGYLIKDWLPETNNVYVLDEELNVTGTIEGLADDELVRSARFMGDIGYFVTFKQTDPLFSVDFSNPKKPKILGELKISGFSEYLHFYSENLLLGIGYEADEETGRTEGVKLSMFDISDPKDVKEIHKLVLEYEHSNALYNHNAVLVSPGKNLIGFEAEAYSTDYVREYAVYSYDAKKGFEEKYKFDCTPDEYHYEARGTYISDTFYLLKQKYGVGAYDINTGKLKDELTMTETSDK